MLTSHNHRLAAVGALFVTLFTMSLLLPGCLAGGPPPAPPKLALQWDPPSTGQKEKAGNLAIAIVNARITGDK